MKKILLASLLGLLVLSCSPAVHAQTSMTFVTPAQAKSGGLPVDASVTFTVSQGKLVITLTNLTPNTISSNQLLTDISFKLSGNVGFVNSFSSSSQDVTIKSTGMYSLGKPGVSTGWGFLGAGNSLVLCVVCPLGMQPGGGYGGPGIIGSGPYNNANASIDKSKSPFLYQTATFTIFDKNITAGTTITSTVFSFGTGFGLDLVNGVPSGGMPTTPEPQSMFLFGTGLILVGGILRRRLITS
jgi:PEP-CTERM motif-containing protein